MTNADELLIRRATSDDGPAIGDLWLGAWRETFDFPPGYPDDDVRRWLTEELVVRHETWVADHDDRAVAVMALSESMVEQLYVAPAWIGRGVGRRLLDHGKTRRPDGIDLYCFQVNMRARRFYERNGFHAIAWGDGSGNVERQPDIRFAWRPGAEIVVPGDDGTPLAVYRSGTADGPPLLLVHGAAADHTTFRVVGPMLGATFDVWAMDRRGRGGSGDTLPYAIEREFEDLAAVAGAIATRRDVEAIDVFGHSYGGRCALGAALGSTALRRLVVYEGAPSPPGERYGDAALADELGALADAGRDDELLATFMTRVVGMTPDELARYRADPVWPRRVRAAPTIARELLVEASADAGIERLGAVRQPVLQLLGGDSLPAFGSATRALDARLRDGRVVVIPGAKHAAHHTHPDAVVAAVESFLLDLV